MLCEISGALILSFWTPNHTLKNMSYTAAGTNLLSGPAYFRLNVALQGKRTLSLKFNDQVADFLTGIMNSFKSK